MTTRIEELREEQDVSRAELARRSGLSYYTLTQLESGERKKPAPSAMINRVAKALGVKADEILGAPPAAVDAEEEPTTTARPVEPSSDHHILLTGRWEVVRDKDGEHLRPVADAELLLN